MIPMYPKSKVYAEVTTEYSPEELRAIRYFLERNTRANRSCEMNQEMQPIVTEPSIMSTSQKILVSFFKPSVFSFMITHN